MNEKLDLAKAINRLLILECDFFLNNDYSGNT
jgi:hypothetical protein